MLGFASVFAMADTNGAKPELADRAQMLEARLMLAISAARFVYATVSIFSL